MIGYIFFLQFIIGSLITPIPNLTEKHELKHVLYIFEVPEELIKYVSRYSAKCLKSKVQGDFRQHSVY